MTKYDARANCGGTAPERVHGHRQLNENQPLATVVEEAGAIQSPSIMRQRPPRARCGTVPPEADAEPSQGCGANSEVIANRTEWTQRALRLLRRLEPPNDSLTLPCRLV